MRVHFLGGADEVGASCLLVESDGCRILVDAGIRMGGRDRLPHLSLMDEFGRPDVICVTHAHLDHSGALPVVHVSMPHVPVLATKPTVSLLRVLLLDAIRVMAMKEAQEEEIPLYPRQAVEALLARVHGVDFLEPKVLCDGRARVIFFPAGHVLGAASVGIETTEGSVLVTGDVSLSDQLTVPGMPRPAFRPDLLVSESTYGARLHASRPAEEARLRQAVLEVLEAGGKVLIPAFALGRAQEVILLLQKALNQAPPEVRLYVDGMVRAIDSVYERHPEALTPRLRSLAQRQKSLFARADGRVVEVSSQEERQAVVEGPPAVVVSSSGMLAGGPSSWYAAQLAGRPDVLIAITGYQDEEAPGRRLQELADGTSREIVFQGETVQVQCRVATYGLSAHADAEELAGLAAALKPGAVALVHGDGEARLGLARALVDRGIDEVELPTVGSTVEVRRVGTRTARPQVRGIGHGRAFDEQAVAELHAHLARRERASKRPFSALELAEHWFGSSSVPVDLSAVREVLARCHGLFRPDTKRPYLYRWVDRAAAEEEIKDIEASARMEQNAALALVDEILGPDSGLRRRGADRSRWVLRLAFDFPDAVRERLRDAFSEIEARTGWTVELSPEANLGAFAALLAERMELPKPPSIRREQRLVVARVAQLPEPEEQENLRAWFAEQTGWRLEFQHLGNKTPRARQARDASGRMEINMAFRAIDQAFGDQPHKPYKKSKKPSPEGQTVIELAFVSPEVGRRYDGLLQGLEKETGWSIRIAEKVDQIQVLAAARRLIPESWPVTKGPGLDLASRRVLVRLSAPVPEKEVARISALLEEETGCTLSVKQK